MSSIPKIIVAGADGKMGQKLLALCLDKGALAGALVQSNSPWLGKAVGQMLGNNSAIVFEDNNETVIRSGDVLIDFTRPDGTMSFLPICVANGVAMVIGTTGFSTEEKAAIHQASNHIAIVQSTNMAPGVNVLFHLVEKAAGLLPDYDAEIFEAHHKMKVDAPSGTALSLGERVLKGRGINEPLENHAEFSRHGHTGARKTGKIGFSVVRGGDIVGEHQVMLIGAGETINLKHLSTDRGHYANGAILSAFFLLGKPPGAYGMHQVLGLP